MKLADTYDLGSYAESVQVQVLSPPPKTYYKGSIFHKLNKLFVCRVSISVSIADCHFAETSSTLVHGANKFIILYKIIGGSKVPVKYR